MTEDVQKQLHKAVGRVTELLASGDLGLLVRESSAAAAAFPEIAFFWSSLAYAHQQRGEFQSAVEASRRALATEPSNWTALLSGGLALDTLGQDLEQALDWLLRAADIHPIGADATRRASSVALRLAYFDDETSRTAEEKEKFKAIAKGLLDIQALVVTPAIRSVPEWASEVGATIMPAGSIERIPFLSPRVAGRDEIAEPIWVDSNAPYVATLENVQIRSQSSFIVTPDGNVLNDVGADEKFGRFADWRYDSAVRAQQGRKIALDWTGTNASIERGIMLSGLASDAFGHWLPEYLARLPALMHHPEFAQLPLIVDEGMPASHFEYLALLVDNPLYRLPPGTLLTCGKLIAAPPPSFHPVELFPNDISPQFVGGLSPRALRFYQARIGERLPRTESASGRRVFLSRSAQRWRRLLNEEEIYAKLEPLGFERMLPENLSLRQQIELFRSSEAIVAPNGSALHNVIFASTQIAVVVLSQGDLHNWGCYQGTIEELGYRPIFVCGSRERGKHEHYTLNPADVIETLARLGIT